MESLKTVLQYVYDNVTQIVIIVALAIGIYQKVRNYLSLSKEERIAIAKTQLGQTMLKYITESEINYENWVKAGSVKRSEVISKIFNDYPILSKITDQDGLIGWIDDLINSSLKTLRTIVKENSEVKNADTTTTTTTTTQTENVTENAKNDQPDETLVSLAN